MDPVHFSGKELIDMAIRIEENGEKYYSGAAASVPSDKVAELFRFLANEERNHIAFLKKIARIEEGISSLVPFDPYVEEASDYIRVVADSKVFTNPDEGERLAKLAPGEKEALEVAIGMEKDSLLFYYEFIKALRERDRPVLDAIIGEEKKHLRKLITLKKALFGETA